jgi:hypothetical protein
MSTPRIAIGCEGGARPPSPIRTGLSRIRATLVRMLRAAWPLAGLRGFATIHPTVTIGVAAAALMVGMTGTRLSLPLPMVGMLAVPGGRTLLVHGVLALVGLRLGRGLRGRRRRKGERDGAGEHIFHLISPDLTGAASTLLASSQESRGGGGSAAGFKPGSAAARAMFCGMLAITSETRRTGPCVRTPEQVVRQSRSALRSCLSSRCSPSSTQWPASAVIACVWLDIPTAGVAMAAPPPSMQNGAKRSAISSTSWRKGRASILDHNSLPPPTEQSARLMSASGANRVTRTASKGPFRSSSDFRSTRRSPGARCSIPRRRRI